MFEALCAVGHSWFPGPCVQGRIPRKLKTKGRYRSAVGVYIIPILGFLGSSALLLFASTVTPCIKRCLQRTTNIVAPVADDKSKYEDEMEDEVDLDFEANLLEMQRTALEAFDSDFVINPKLYVSFNPAEHPIFGAEIRMRRATVVNRRQDREKKVSNRRTGSLPRRNDAERRNSWRSRNCVQKKLKRLHDYVESMARKKKDDEEKMRKRAEAKRKRRKQQKSKRTRAKRLYDMDRSGQNFIV